MMSGRVWRPPDWKKWTWPPIRPGMIHRSAVSTRAAVSGIGTSPRRPTATMRSPSTTSTASGIGASPVPSITAAPSKATWRSAASAIPLDKARIANQRPAARRISLGRRHIGGATKADHVKADVARIAVAIRDPEAIRIVAPAATAQAPPFGHRWRRRMPRTGDWSPRNASGDRARPRPFAAPRPARLPDRPSRTGRPEGQRTRETATGSLRARRRSPAQGPARPDLIQRRQQLIDIARHDLARRPVAALGEQAVDRAGLEVELDRVRPPMATDLLDEARSRIDLSRRSDRNEQIAGSERLLDRVQLERHLPEPHHVRP